MYKKMIKFFLDLFKPKKAYYVYMDSSYLPQEKEDFTSRYVVAKSKEKAMIKFIKAEGNIDELLDKNGKIIVEEIIND